MPSKNCFNLNCSLKEQKKIFLYLNIIRQHTSLRFKQLKKIIFLVKKKKQVSHKIKTQMAQFFFASNNSKINNLFNQIFQLMLGKTNNTKKLHKKMIQQYPLQTKFSPTSYYLYVISLLVKKKPFFNSNKFISNYFFHFLVKNMASLGKIHDLKYKPNKISIKPIKYDLTINNYLIHKTKNYSHFSPNFFFFDEPFQIPRKEIETLKKLYFFIKYKYCQSVLNRKSQTKNQLFNLA